MKCYSNRFAITHAITCDFDTSKFVPIFVSLWHGVVVTQRNAFWIVDVFHAIALLVTSRHTRNLTFSFEDKTTEKLLISLLRINELFHYAIQFFIAPARDHENADESKWRKATCSGSKTECEWKKKKIASAESKQNGSARNSLIGSEKWNFRSVCAGWRAVKCFRCLHVKNKC